MAVQKSLCLAALSPKGNVKWTHVCIMKTATYYEDCVATIKYPQWKIQFIAKTGILTVVGITRFEFTQPLTI